MCTPTEVASLNMHFKLSRRGLGARYRLLHNPQGAPGLPSTSAHGASWPHCMARRYLKHAARARRKEEQVLALDEEDQSRVSSCA